MAKARGYDSIPFTRRRNLVARFMDEGFSRGRANELVDIVRAEMGMLPSREAEEADR